MALPSGQDRQTARARLATLVHPVTLRLFRAAAVTEASDVARQVLGHLEEVSDLVAVDEVDAGLQEGPLPLGLEGLPAIVVLRGSEDARLRFLGAPVGYEFLSLVEAVCLAGGDDSGLSADNKALIAAHVRGRLDIKVFTTPTCVYCPSAVTLALRMAVESPLISATCVEATAFIELSRRYRVTGVPKTVVNGVVEIIGAVAEDAFVRTIVLPPGNAVSESPSAGG